MAEFWAPSPQDAESSNAPLLGAAPFAPANAIGNLMMNQAQIQQMIQNAQQQKQLFPGQLEAQQNQLNLAPVQYGQAQANLKATQEGNEFIGGNFTTPAQANAQIKSELQTAGLLTPDISSSINDAFDPNDDGTGDDSAGPVANSAVADYAAAMRAAAAMKKAGVSTNLQDEKMWQKLSSAMDMFIKGRGNMIMNTITRAKQGLAILNSYSSNPTPQLLNALYDDVASIMTGGVATGQAAADASYHTIFSDLDNKLAYWTGSLSGAQKLYKQAFGGVTPLNNILQQLSGQLTDLLNTATGTLQSQLLSEAAGYQQIVANDPDRFQRLVNSKLATAGGPGINTPTVTVNKLGQAISPSQPNVIVAPNATPSTGWGPIQRVQQ